jgi:hypothetical protein
MVFTRSHLVQSVVKRSEEFKRKLLGLEEINYYYQFSEACRLPYKMAQSMYALKPVFDLDAKVDIPSCMYSLPVIQSSTPIDGIGMTKVKEELCQFITRN